MSGLHLQFGADAATEVIASWHTSEAIGNPRVLLGTPSGGCGLTIQAEPRTHRDAKSGSEIRINHARLTALSPDTDYVYAAIHDGAAPELGTFRTAPRGRAAFTFTSFGDQSTPTLSTPQGPTSFVNDHRGSPAAGDVTTGIERIAPLFNLVNGDLCYANLAADRIRAWSDWFDNNSRSARLDNDDICYQDAGNSYVRGYSGGAQRRFLEAELAAAQANTDIDWIVVCMHQTAISTADANGADLAIREQWLPLFDRYGVDLVVCGHEHHYELSDPVRELSRPTRGRRSRSNGSRWSSHDATSAGLRPP